MLHGEDNSFNKFFNLLIQPANICVHFRRFLIDFHSLDSTVVFGRECIEHEVRILVETKQVSWLERGWINESNDGEEYCLTGRGLDDSRLASSQVVEIHIGAWVVKLYLTGGERDLLPRLHQRCPCQGFQ